MTQPYSFNLVDEPWIPCLRHDGTPVDLSLRETLVQAHALRMVADDAPQTTAAILRLLLAIMHRVFGPADREEWLALWQAGRVDVAALDDYFDRWRHRFDLFDAERPFYQVDDLRVQPKPVISLKYGIGFLHDLHYDHADSESGFTLSPATAARALVTLHAFGLGGLSGISEKHVDGPCASGVLFFVHGDNLFQTLLLNMPAYPEEAFFRFEDADAPAWEQDDPYDKGRVYPLGLLDYLTWQSRQPLLFAQQGEDNRVQVAEYKLGPGRRLASGVQDPYKVYSASKTSGYLPLRFTEDKGLWRNSAALFNFDITGTQTTQAPTTFRWLAGLVANDDDGEVLPKAKTYRCLALGLSKDRGKMLYSRHETLPLLPAYLADPDLVRHLTAALDQTEQIAYSLLSAARVAGMHLFVANAEGVQWQSLPQATRGDIDKWVAHTGVERAYWAALDVPFQSFLVRLPVEGVDARTAWAETLRDTALNALGAIHAYTPGDGRSFKALVFAQRSLRAGLRKVLPSLYSESADKGLDEADLTSVSDSVQDDSFSAIHDEDLEE